LVGWYFSKAEEQFRNNKAKNTNILRYKKDYMGLIKSYKDLDIWKKGMELSEIIYDITKQFPSEEKYGLVSQMRRCAVSFPSNVAEGSARNSYKEFIQFLYIALGSLSELETQLILAKRLNISSNDFEKQIEQLKKQTNSFIKHLKTKY
jgi:four helix bundle protein